MIIKKYLENDSIFLIRIYTNDLPDFNDLINNRNLGSDEQIYI